jgi:pimeloyl-ACP methyl ester carboxylesterase
MPLKEHTITINNRSVSYVEGGQGQPLVYIHGWPLSPRPTDPMLQKLAEDFYLYAPKLPGFGDSEPLDSLHTVGNLANFLEDFTNALGLKKVVLLGCSLGGMIDLAYALKNRDKVSALVIVGSSGSHRYLANRFLKTLCTILSRLWRRFGFVERVLKKVVDSDRLLAWIWTRITPLDPQYQCLRDDPTIQNLRRISLKVSKEIFDSVLHLDLIPQCGRLKKVPTLLLAGQNDTLITIRAVKELDEAIGTSIFMVVPYAEHWNTLTDDSLRLIKNFLLRSGG